MSAERVTISAVRIDLGTRHFPFREIREIRVDAVAVRRAYDLSVQSLSRFRCTSFGVFTAE